MQWCFHHWHNNSYKQTRTVRWGYSAGGGKIQYEFEEEEVIMKEKMDQGKGGYKGVTRMAYSPSLWLMAIGWWNKNNQCRKLKLNLTQTWGVCMSLDSEMHWSQNQWYCDDKLRKKIFFFLGGVTATAPSRDLTDNKKKRREGSSKGESKRKLLKETQNQRKETRKKKKKIK